MIVVIWQNEAKMINLFKVPPEIPHHTSSVLGAKISLSSTRRALRPCSWTYCATVSSTGRAALKP